MARTCIAPVERIKILFQIRSGVGAALTARSLFADTVRSQGILSLWNGNSAAVVRVIPYAAAHFVFFEEYRRGLRLYPNTLQLGTVPIDLMAGSAAGVSAVLVTYPLDLARAKLATSSEFRGIGHVLVSAVQQSGFKGLYRGWPYYACFAFLCERYDQTGCFCDVRDEG